MCHVIHVDFFWHKTIRTLHKHARSNTFWFFMFDLWLPSPSAFRFPSPCTVWFDRCQWSSLLSSLLQALRGPADLALNHGPSSWDSWRWTSDHGPWARVTRCTRYFISCCSCVDVMLVYGCDINFGFCFGGFREALGDACGIIEEQFKDFQRILDKSRQIMLTCDVIWWWWWVFNVDDVTCVCCVLESAWIKDLDLCKVGIWTCWYFIVNVTRSSDMQSISWMA